MLSKSLRLIVTLLTACLFVVAAAPVAQAGDPSSEEDGDSRKEAGEHFRRGVKLYKDRDYVAALVEFKRAYELAPNYRVLYNLGQTSRELKDYASALVAYRQYLDEGGDEIGAARKKEVERVLEELTERVGTLTITTNVEGAEIQVDDEVVGVSPLDEPVVVNIGKRRVGATLAGHAPAGRVIEVAGRDELDVELELTDLARKPSEPLEPSPSPKPGPVADEGGVPVAGIVALSVTAACGIAAGVLGGLTLSARSDLDDALATFPGNPQEIEDAQGRVTTLATVTDVMLGITAAGAVTTLVLFLVNPGSGSDDPEEPSSARVTVTPSYDGLWVTGTF